MTVLLLAVPTLGCSVDGVRDPEGLGGAGAGGATGGGTGDEECKLVGDQRFCDEAGIEGICADGIQTCREDHTWSGCSIRPAPRDCSSSDDNDCDGQPDDVIDEACKCEIGATRACQAELDGVGICRAGEESCVLSADGETSTWSGDCEGAVAPGLRECGSEEDNDCDGQADDVLDDSCQCTPGDVETCGLPATLNGVGACQFGYSSCEASEDGTESEWTSCEGAVTPAAPDCSAIEDYDCDGLSDYFSCTESVSSGLGHACIINTENEVRCWGCFREDLSEPECLTNNKAPWKIELGSATPVATASGHANGCVLFADTTVACFSFEAGRPLVSASNGGVAPSDEGRVAVVQGLTGAESLGTGQEHACALIDDGSVTCWGANAYGQLGHATDVGCETSFFDQTDCVPQQPAQVSGLVDVEQIAVGLWHTCAMVDGDVLCWGKNESGQLGDGTTTGGATPVQVTGVAAATAIAAGAYHTCALLQDKSVTCWGENVRAGLSSAEPVAVEGLGDVIEISAKGEQTCAVLESGAVTCWGYWPLTFDAPAAGVSTQTVSAGGKFACVAREGGVFCERDSEYLSYFEYDHDSDPPETPGVIE